MSYTYTKHLAKNGLISIIAFFVRYVNAELLLDKYSWTVILCFITFQLVYLFIFAEVFFPPNLVMSHKALGNMYNSAVKEKI